MPFEITHFSLWLWGIVTVGIVVVIYGGFHLLGYLLFKLRPFRSAGYKRTRTRWFANFRPVFRSKCPYCKSKLSPLDDIVSCKLCHTGHHLSCWRETHKCSVFGCNGI